MMKKFRISKYLDEITVHSNYFPVDLYFIQERAQKKGKILDPEIIRKKINSENYMLNKQNTLIKYDYNGQFHNTPINPLSQIINPQNIYNIEKDSN